MTRSVSRELDHVDPIPGRYTLEVTSPGVERALRTPEHFAREIGKEISVRLRDPGAAERRLTGLLIAADADTATIRVGFLDDGEPDDRVIPIAGIDRARTIFEWGPAPKPGGPRKGARPPKSSNDRPTAGRDTQDITPSTTEETP